MATFSGTSGADTLTGGAGADTLIGGSGNDSYEINSLGDVVVEASGGGTDTIVTSVLDGEGLYSLLLWPQVENLRYSGALAALLLGNGLSNRIEANAATATADYIDGGNGNDSLFGFAGADRLVGGSGNDLLDGGTGADRLIGGMGDDTYIIDIAGDRISELAGGGRDLVRSAVAFDLSQDWASEVEDLTYTGTIAAALIGNEQANRITSLGAGADSLSGGDGNDTLSGGGGADSLSGGAGDDYYVLGAGDVVVEAAGGGRDAFEGLITSIAQGPTATTIENLVHTGTGATLLTGNALSNVIEGGSGANTLNGGLGSDTLAGGAGADQVNGGEGEDWLFGGSLPALVLDRSRVNDISIDQLAGGLGNDTYVISDTRDLVSEGLTDGTLDVVLSGVSNRLSRYANVEVLILENGSSAYSAGGSAASDLIIGNDGSNLVRGGLADDTLSGWGLTIGSGGSDVLLGEAGNDVLLAVAFSGALSASDLTTEGGTGSDLYVIGPGLAPTGIDDGGSDTAVILGSATLAQLSGVERVYLYGAMGSPDAAVRAAIGGAYAALSGGGLHDSSTLQAGLHATGNSLGNSMFGNNLSNRLAGGAGNDTINGGVGNDTLIAGAGIDRLIGGVGNDTLIAGAGIDRLIGGAGNDTYLLDTGDLVTETLNGGFDILSSGSLSSISAFGAYGNMEGWLYTGSLSVNLHRGTTNTTADLLGGGSGNDTLSGYGGDDTLRGGDGHDLLSGGTGANDLSGEAGNDSLYGGGGNESMSGGAGDDILADGLGDDTLDGGSGNDSLSGGGNWDSLRGGSGEDQINGDDGRDTLEGESGNDTLDGGNNSDSLFGGGGNDTLLFGAFAPPETDYPLRGDHLFGDDPGNAGISGADEFRATSFSPSSGITETFVGSNQFIWASGTTIGDFQPGIDRIGLPGAAYQIGDQDSVVDGITDFSSGGATFSASDEIIFVRQDASSPFASSLGAFFSPINVNTIGPLVGTADAAIPINTSIVMVFDDGANSALFLFNSLNGNAAVDLDELYLIAVVTGTDALQSDDLFFF